MLSLWQKEKRVPTLPLLEKALLMTHVLQKSWNEASQLLDLAVQRDLKKQTKQNNQTCISLHQIQRCADFKCVESVCF